MSGSENKDDNILKNKNISRKDFMKLLGVGTFSLGMGSIIGFDKLIPKVSGANGTYNNKNYYNDNLKVGKRAIQAYNIRVDAAIFERDFRIPDNYNNGDETLYKDKIASFSKSLPHNNLGIVDPDAYSQLIYALETKDFRDFEKIPMGGTKSIGIQSNFSNTISAFEFISATSNNYLKLANPIAAFSFELIGPDSHHLYMKPAPKLDSTEEIGEIVELYWHAIAKEIPFTEYENSSLIFDACKDLSRVSTFYGPKSYGEVTPKTIFRGNAFGNLDGPYISQFLLKPIPFGAMTVEQKYNVSLPGSNYMTSYNNWLHVQNGIVTEQENIDTTPRYLRNGGDLAEFVHKDFPFQAYLNACLILLGNKYQFDSDNRYNSSVSQSGFGTFGPPHALHIISCVANLAIKAAWFQKWLVHRRLRPEVFASYVHNNMIKKTDFPINKEIFDSYVLDIIYKKYNSYLLPMAYPEGSPTHPAYPAGHAVIAGACTTVLKAFFDENVIIREPVIPTHDGQSLIPYQGYEELTVGGEINKLGANIAIGRDFAGVHWRSDSIEGMKLGEELAIRFLLEQTDLFYDKSSFKFTKIDGSKIEI